MSHPHNEKLVTRLGAREYFQEVVQSALANQQFHASDESVVYLVNLLVNFLRSENLFDKTPDGLMIKPLAVLYEEALAANSSKGRVRALQRLGDLALFISGLFANSLGRCLVDVDYYISMGGNAYASLAVSNRLPVHSQALKIVFDELSEKFSGYVGILAEVGEESQLSSNTDIMRLYEIWQCTGSKRIANRLQDLGIQPVKICRTRH